MRVGSQFAQIKLREQVSSVIVGQKSLIKEALREENLELLVEFRPSCVIGLCFPNCNIFLLRVRQSST